MRAFFTVVFALFAVASTSAFAKDQKPADPNKKICRREAVTGSILGGKSICHTRAEWTTIDEANEKATRQFGDAARRSGGLRDQ